MNDPVLVTVPLLNEDAGAAAARPGARAETASGAIVARPAHRETTGTPDPESRTPEPAGFTATVLGAGCATCQGHCCKGGGEHAYIDERTMARVRRDHPELDARGIIGLYLDALAPRSYAGPVCFMAPTGARWAAVCGPNCATLITAMVCGIFSA